ncbi:MAG: hypothetical protein M3P06_00755 [Acidobacteriota bacterium]|nr:hypothetical protein [Acidobacteriota bacterium]
MPRRSLALALLLVLAVQFVGAMVFASACPEPCPDDTETTSCPPVCTLCSDCTHAQQAIVRQPANGPSLAAARRIHSLPSLDASSHVADEIFHVPLFG